jgi:site-specific recombinase XerD
VPTQTAVDAFAPVTSERNTVEHWLGEYVERSTERDELSLNTRRAIESHARLDIAPWWSARPLTEIDASTLDEWTRWLRKKRGLSAKSVRNALGVFHSFLRWLRRVGRFDQLPESRTSMSRSTPPRSSLPGRRHSS